MTWPIIFLLVILKIPVAYLCAVVWWAIRSESAPDAPADTVGVRETVPDAPGWTRARQPRPGRGPQRRPGPRRPAVRAGARR